MKRYGDWVTDPRHTHRWKKVRAFMLQAYPLCERCGMRCATEVHHIYSPRLYPLKAYDTRGLRSLCHACHTEADRGEVTYRKRADADTDSGDSVPPQV